MKDLFSASARGLLCACRGTLLLWVAGALPIHAEVSPGAGEPVPLVRLADAQIELGRLAEASASLRAALASDPGNAEAHRKLGALLAVTDHPAAGVGHLERAVELAPGDAAAHLELAEVLRMTDRWAEALALYERALELGLVEEDVLTGRAEALVAVGRLEEAREQLDRGLELFPDSRGLRFGLAWVCAAGPDAELRDGARALALAQELFLDRRSLGAAELIAAARAELGRCDEAASLQSFVVQQARSHDRPAEVLRRLEQALAWFEGESCAVPEGRPVSERPYWPRRRPTAGVAG